MISVFFKILGEHNIIRRYIIMNSFDGALTILGIILASFFVGIENPFLVLLPSFGAAVALCVSGIWSAYVAESVEVKKTMNELESHLLRKLHGTKLIEKHKKMAVVIALVNGLSPMIVALLIISPFAFVILNTISIKLAYYISIALVGVILFFLGVFAGKIAKESLLKHGLMMVLAGIVIGVIFYILVILGVL